MINKNMINTSGVDLLKGFLTNVDTSQYFVPLFKIKLDTLAENDIQIETYFNVNWFSANENYTNKFLAKFTITNNIASLEFQKLDLVQGVGIQVCFIKSGLYYICYAKGGNKYFNITSQITYCNYPEEIQMCIDDENIAVANISSYSPTYPSFKYTIGITTSSNYYQAKNDFQQFTKYLRDGTCILNISFYTNSTITAGETICTIDKHPIQHNLPVLLYLRKISDASVIGVASGLLTTGGALQILNVPSGLESKVYISANIIYNSVNVSI